MTLKTKQQLIANSQDLTKAIINFRDFPLTNSLAIAEQFGKQHKHVLRDIKEFKESLNNSDKEDSPILGAPKEIYFISENHYLSEQNKELPLYVINKNVALFIIMGYTGDKARKIKMNFIERFNELEKEVADKKKVFAGSKGGYKGQFERVKNENEDLKLRVAKLEALGREYQDRAMESEEKLNIALKGMLKIAEDIEKIQNK